MTNTHDGNELSSEKKRELLAKLLQEQARNPQIFPMSFAQQRLWFIEQLQPGNFANHIWGALRLTGFLNQAALSQTFNEIVCRHEVLRTSFAMMKGKPVQIIIPTLKLDLSTINLEGLAEVEQEAEIQKLVIQEIQQPFNLEQAPLLRVNLLCLKETEHILVLTMHHVISDGWSVGVLVEEVTTLYEAFSNGQPSKLTELPIQYVDFTSWQQQKLQGEVLKSQISYWKQQLKGAPQLLELPTDKPRPVVTSFQGAIYSFELSYELHLALKRLSQQQGSTLFMTLLAAFKTLLYHYTYSEDIIIGSPIANRDRTELEGLIGLFANTIALRTNLAGNPTFEELLTRVRKVALDAYAHQDLPFEQLVEELQPQRNLSYTPVFQVMFVLQNTPMPVFELPALTLAPLQIDNGSAKFDLTLEITETREKLFASLEFDTDLFELPTIKRMARHFEALLEAIVVNPQQRLSDLPLLTEFEQHQLLREWNDTEIEYPQDKCIYELFEAQVEKTPDAVAVVFKNQELTYRELNQRANQLAHYLQKLGVKPEVLVGICVERSLEMVIGLLAILKAGGAYVPLDPSYPQERIAFILEETQASVLLTQASLFELIPQHHQAQVVCLDTDWHLIAQQSQENLFSQLTADNLAYTIYTSGSTGKPKGVQISHIALSNFLHSMKESPGLTSSDTLLAVTTYSFDIAALELFLPIIIGARLVIASREIVADGTQLSAKLVDSKATVIQATPATWQLLLAAGWGGGNHQLKILCGGEALPGHLAKQLLERCDCLWNMYGPTETTIWSAASQVETVDNTVPISTPIANTQIYILDKYHQLVPVGVTGELCIGGEGLARGYFHRPDLTAEKFIPNTFSYKPARLYRTGDLARYLPNGDIEYIGRIDNQVKVRGFRIELGEIEAIISQYPGVQEVAVVIHASEIDSQRIVAYIVPREEQVPTISELRGFLEAKLPSYMIPAAFLTLKALPLTSNGKVDRKALPKPDNTRPQLEVVYQQPQTEIEQTIADIWQEVLNVEDLGIYDNFFELGGHSLLLVQVHSKLREVFKRDLSLLDLFRYPTIKSLANYFNQAENQQPYHDIMADMSERIADGKAQQRKRLQKIKAVENI